MCRSEESKLQLLQSEVQLTEDIIREKDPKCYAVWHHRRWLFQKWLRLLSLSCRRPALLTEREIMLCERMLQADQRNFHCWNHWMLVTARSVEGSPLGVHMGPYQRELEQLFRVALSWGAFAVSVGREVPFRCSGLLEASPLWYSWECVVTSRTGSQLECSLHRVRRSKQLVLHANPFYDCYRVVKAGDPSGGSSQEPV